MVKTRRMEAYADMMEYFKGTLRRHKTRTQYIVTAHRRRIRGKDRLWPPFISREPCETLRVYLIRDEANDIQNTLNIPFTVHVIKWKGFIDANEQELVFDEARMEKLRPDQYIGKEIGVWAHLEDGEYYPTRIKEVK